MILVADIDEALRAAGIPITGVSMPSKDDRTTWRVSFAASATQQQQDAAAALIAAFVEPTDAARLDKLAQAETSDKKLQAATMALWECIPSPLLTKAQLKTRIIAIYKSL